MITAMPEQAIHKAVVAHLRQRGVSGLVFWHTPNGVRGRSRKHHIQGAIAKGLGVRAGVSDLVLLHCGHACIAEGLDRALRVLETWGLLRGQAAIVEGPR